MKENGLRVTLVLPYESLPVLRVVLLCFPSSAATSFHALPMVFLGHTNATADASTRCSSLVSFGWREKVPDLWWAARDLWMPAEWIVLNVCAHGYRIAVVPRQHDGLPL